MGWLQKSIGLVLLAIVGVVAALCHPTAANAQATVPLPQTFTLSPGGVDLQSGHYLYQHDDISIGDLTLTRTWAGMIARQVDQFSPLGAGFVHNMRIAAKETRARDPDNPTGPISQYDYLVTLHLGATTVAFRRHYPVTDDFAQSGGYPAGTLTFAATSSTPAGCAGPGSGRAYTYVDRASTTYIFCTTASSGGDCGANCGYVSSITKANGEKLSFTYDAASTFETRLRAVVSNRGYALAFDYATGDTRIAAACTINLAVTAFTPGSACPSAAPKAEYTYSSSDFTYKDPAGGIYTFSNEATSLTQKTITLPGYTAPWLTVTFVCSSSCAYDAKVSGQTFADGSYYDYAYTDSSQGFTIKTVYTNAAGATAVEFDQAGEYYGDVGFKYTVAAGPGKVTDPLSNATTTQYCGSGSGATCTNLQYAPISQMMPEGNSASYTYGPYLDPIKVVLHPKPGSSLADREITAAYDPVDGGGPDRPTSITDAELHTTTRKYDTTHLQLTEKTRPADPGGNSPKTRYAYAQRSAYVLNTAGSAYVALPSIWLLSDERFCRTSNASGAGCVAGANDLVLTAYDYGPNSGPNTLLLRGMTVTSQGVTLRTCYGYDAQANRISETTPRAGLTSCP